MSTAQTTALLARIEARAWADAYKVSMPSNWRHAAAHVSGMLSMKAELLLIRPRRTRA